MLNQSLIDIINRLHVKMNIEDNAQLLFVNKTGEKAINIQYINRRLKEIVKQYIPQSKLSVSSHLFRKTLGRHVWAVNDFSERSLILLGELFNHSSVKITKIYLGIKEDEIGDVYMKL